MAARHILTIDVTEITALEVRCKCGGQVSLPISYRLEGVMCCPGCGKTLLDVNDAGPAVAELSKSLLNWKRLQEKKCSVTFTIDFPSAQGEA